MVEATGRPITNSAIYSSKIIKAEALDNTIVKFTTDQPVAPLLNFVCNRLIVTSKSIFEKYGREAADKEHMMGAGPYRLKELVLGQRLEHRVERRRPAGENEWPLPRLGRHL